jgi:hypothetical protein
MIVLGADTHKRSHTITAVAAATGELLGEQTVPVGRRGFGALLQWARALDGERAWALEGESSRRRPHPRQGLGHKSPPAGGCSTSRGALGRSSRSRTEQLPTSALLALGVILASGRGHL